MREAAALAIAARTIQLRARQLRPKVCTDQPAAGLLAGCRRLRRRRQRWRMRWRWRSRQQNEWWRLTHRVPKMNSGRRYNGELGGYGSPHSLRKHSSAWPCGKQDLHEEIFILAIPPLCKVSLGGHWEWWGGGRGRDEGRDERELIDRAHSRAKSCRESGGVAALKRS